MRSIKGIIVFSILVVALVTWLPGCGPAGRKITTADANAFNDASPELKEKWAKAQAAAATNDYVGSILTLRSMLSAGLSKPQVDAVQDALASYDAQLMKAVAKGDAAAQKALETLRSPGAQLGR